LALFVGVEKEADYCQITETFLDIIDLHLADVKRKALIKSSPMGRSVTY